MTSGLPYWCPTVELSSYVSTLIYIATDHVIENVLWKAKLNFVS